MKYLNKKIENYKKELSQNIKSFRKSKEKYWNRLYGKELIVIFNKNNSRSYKNVGFPFPILSEEFKQLNKEGSSLMIFLTGEKVLNFQREQLITELELLKKVNVNEISDVEKFREITKKIIKNHKYFDYYDPYSFIGDSFIGLYFPQIIEQTFKCELRKVYSENYGPLSSCLKSKGYVGNYTESRGVINIFADLIANQWNRTKYLVKKITENNEPSIVIGRDLIILPSEDVIDVFHFNREGVLLRDENIESYMNECLYPFIKVSKEQIKQKLKIKSDNLIINPFGSNEAKTIPVDLVCKLIEEYKKFNKDSKILVISGFKHSYSHLLWTAQLRLFIFKKGFEREVILKDYGSFTEIKKDLFRYNIQIGITSDTSMAHLFNHLNLLNITLFNLNRIDLSSPQSLASDGPLGFCRYSFNQIPVLFRGKYETKIKEGILETIEYFKGKRKDKLWARKIFNEKILLNKISRENKKLVESNYKINPFNKLK